MYVAHVRLVLHNSYKCKFKGFRTVFSYERKVKGALARLATMTEIIRITSLQLLCLKINNMSWIVIDIVGQKIVLHIVAN